MAVHIVEQALSVQHKLTPLLIDLVVGLDQEPKHCSQLLVRVLGDDVFFLQEVLGGVVTLAIGLVVKKH